MPKLIENVLIGDRVRLAGEDISEVDAKGVRPEVFATEAAPAAEDEPVPAAEAAPAAEDEPAENEPAQAPRARGKGTSTK